MVPGIFDLKKHNTIACSVKCSKIIQNTAFCKVLLWFLQWLAEKREILVRIWKHWVNENKFSVTKFIIREFSFNKLAMVYGLQIFIRSLR